MNIYNSNIDLRNTIAYTSSIKIGSINIFANMPNLKQATSIQCTMFTGNIEIAFTNCYKLEYIHFQFAQWDSSNPAWGQFIGNIYTFSNKYNLKQLVLSGHANINGEIKSLKNLKKLYDCRFYATQVTGSKTDLWNQGVNVTYFGI